MALQVWLPMSGNTINIGLDSSEATTIGEISYTAGLFGGQSFSAGRGAVIANLSSSPADFSMSIWYKASATLSNGTIFAFGGNSGNRIEFDANETAFYWKAESTGVLANNTKLCDVVFNTWNNLVVTADGTTVKVYLNGSLELEEEQLNSIVSALGESSSFYFGSKSDGTGYWSGSIQDIKVYDSAMSKKEVLEISKGLVLEYTFNHNSFGNPNLAYGTDKNFTVNLATGQTSHKYEGYEQEPYTSAYLQPGVYTLSADVVFGVWNDSHVGDPNANDNDPSTVRLALYVYQMPMETPQSRVYVDMEEKGYGTFTVTSAANYFVGIEIFGNGVTNIHGTITRIKIEAGNKRTPWCPRIGEPAYTRLNLDTIEQDVSGNDHDGEFSETAPIWSSDTRIFTGSYDFSNDSYIKSSVFDTSQLTNFTVSIWAKAQVLTGKILFGFDSGNRFNFSTIGGEFGIYDAENSKQVSFGVSVSQYVGQWHLYTITGDGTTEKLYIDGVLAGSITTGYINFGSSRLYINGWDNSTLYNFDGLMSDIRIYATTFSADEVDRLYHQKATIDNSGCVYAASFVEDTLDSAINFKKTSVIEVNELTSFNTPIDEDTKVTDDADHFKITRTKVIATNIFES